MNEALRILARYRKVITRQQFRTLKGQILAGDPTGAIKGLRRILRPPEEKPRKEETV